VEHPASERPVATVTISRSPRMDRIVADGSNADRGPLDTPVSTLRGSGVDVDSRQVVRAAVGLCLVALAVVVVVLLVAGANKNAQINRLRQHGVPVEVTVTTCLGQLGGSGSNAAGYQCRGSFTIDGRHYNQIIPGSALLPLGTTVRGVIDPSDPALISTVAEVDSERASWRVFLLPIALAVVLALLVVAVVIRMGRSRRTR
jgi:hypothetical protein